MEAVVKTRKKRKDAGVPRGPRKGRRPLVVKAPRKRKNGELLVPAVREQYTRDPHYRTPCGNVAMHCGDEIGAQLVDKTLEEVYAIVAKHLKVSEAELHKKYGHLNLGMQRMNLGNRLRKELE